MRIGILTLPLHTNYGGILQAYALCKVLNDAGHEAEVIYLVYPFMPTLKTWAKKLKGFIKGSRVDWLYEYRYVKKMAPATLYTNEFINERIPHTTEVRNKKSLRRLVKKYDTIVVGSDQVWRPLYAQYLDIFFCSFLPNPSQTKCIVYAASFGTDKVEYPIWQQKCCAQYIQRFKAVSVRESSGVDLIKRYGWNCEPFVALDPTLLLPNKEYQCLLNRTSEEKNNRKLFYYMLDMTENKKQLVDDIGIRKNLDPFTVFEKEYSYRDDVIRPQKPVEDWLKGFVDASMVITDSFHGCVFSIIFNRPFIVIANASRGQSRFISLLSLFGLEDRLIKSTNKDEAFLVSQQSIDWDKVNMLRDKLAKESMTFLLSNL